MKSLLEVAKHAARMGGDVINAGAENIADLNIEQKTLHDYVSEIDRGSERVITEVILEAFPDHQILGEEYGKIGEGTQVQWIVDPLDGTTNFIHGFPHFAVSIAARVATE